MVYMMLTGDVTRRFKVRQRYMARWRSCAVSSLAKYMPSSNLTCKTVIGHNTLCSLYLRKDYAFTSSRGVLKLLTVIINDANEKKWRKSYNDRIIARE